MRVIETSMAMVLILAPLKRLTPNGLTLSLSLAWAGKRGQVATQIQRVENRAQIDVEGFCALPGEDADAGRGVTVDPCAAKAG